MLRTASAAGAGTDLFRTWGDNGQVPSVSACVEADLCAQTLAFLWILQV